MRLIDADALIEDCKRYLNTLNPDRDGKECTRIHWLIGVLGNAPTIEPERGSCETCKRASSYCCKSEEDVTRCPIEEHYRLPRDGYCHLYEGR